MQNKLIWALVATIVILVGALSFVMGRQTAPAGAEPTDNIALAAALDEKDVGPDEVSAMGVSPRPTLPVSRNEAAPAKRLDTATGTAFTETFDDIAVKFVPTNDFRRMVEYRLGVTDGDSSCSPPYTVKERIDTINYAYGFVIEDFTTWNEDEGKQEYVAMETSLPNAYKGSLRDLVSPGRIATIEKQRCGQGQVEGLVAIR